MINHQIFAYLRSRHHLGRSSIHISRSLLALPGSLGLLNSPVHCAFRTSYPPRSDYQIVILRSFSDSINRKSSSKMVEKLPKLPPIERLSRSVVRILGDNPSKYTLQGTNTYLVGSGKQRLLIDTGEGRAQWKSSLQQALREDNAEISAVLLTHWHGDHVGGLDDVLDVVGGDGRPEVKVYKNRPWKGQEGISDGQIFEVEGASLRAFFCPGHTNDHMAFVLKEEDAMFAGDNVLGHGTAVFEDLAAYMDSLDRMQHQFRGRIYPGHGAVVEEGIPKIQEYIAHRREREEQALNVLKGDAPQGDGEGWKSMSMVKIIYREYPEHLHEPAEGGLKQVLRKLEKDGRVRQCGDGTWKLTEKAAL